MVYNYFIFSLIAFGISTNAVQAMEDASKIANHPTIKKFEEDLKKNHEDARKSQPGKETPGGYFMSKEHYVAEKITPIIYPINYTECYKCIKDRGLVELYLKPVIQENLLLRSENEKLNNKHTLLLAAEDTPAEGTAEEAGADKY